MSDKRYFIMEDAGARYWGVATDMDHARKILTDGAGDVFGPDETTLADAEATGEIEWTEIPALEARTFKVTDEGRPLGTLHDRNLGDWFCSEW